MVISIGQSVIVNTENIESVVAYGDTGVEIILINASLCFELKDAAMQQQIIELLAMVMHAEDEQQARILADGLKEISYKSFNSFSSRTLNQRLLDIASDIALKN